MNTTVTVYKLQTRAYALFNELQENQENPKQAERIRKELDSVFLQMVKTEQTGEMSHITKSLQLL